MKNSNTKSYCKSALATFKNLPKNLPKEPYDYQPNLPKKFYQIPPLSTKFLSKHIYKKMIDSIEKYNIILKLADERTKNILQKNKNQMETLSIAMLNINQYKHANGLFIFNFSKFKFSKRIDIAFSQLYDQIYHIHSLVQRLFVQTNDKEISSILLIILTNLKSQLKSLDELRKNN